MKSQLLTRYFKVLASYNLGRPVYAPDSVSIIVTNRCNLRCIMCDFWTDVKKDMEGISLDEFKKIFNDLCLFGVKTVQLTGGETFLRRDLVDILAAAKAYGLKTAAVTNGTLIDSDKVGSFVRNCDLIYVSLDAPVKEQHEEIRGVTDIFDKIINSIKLMSDEIRINSLKSKIMICTTITSEGLHEPKDMVALAKDVGVNGIIYNPASSVLYGYANLKRPSSDVGVDRHAYINMVDKILALISDPGNRIRSNPFYLAASKEFIGGNGKYYKFPCFGGGYNGPLIAYDGTLFPCCAWNIPMGNVRKESFSKIWNSKQAKDIRLKIKKGECPICFHHTRTFDFAIRAPLLFPNLRMLWRNYKILLRM